MSQSNTSLSTKEIIEQNESSIINSLVNQRLSQVKIAEMLSKQYGKKVWGATISEFVTSHRGKKMLVEAYNRNQHASTNPAPTQTADRQDHNFIAEIITSNLSKATKLRLLEQSI